MKAVAIVKKRRHPWWCAAREHVVGPDDQPENHNRHDRVHHRHVAEQGLSGVNRQDLTHEAESRQNHDVNGGMGIEPEQMLINHNIPPQCWIEKSRMSDDVEAQKHQSPCQNWR